MFMGIECLEEKRWSEAFKVFENLAKKNVSIAFQFVSYKWLI